MEHHSKFDRSLFAKSLKECQSENLDKKVISFALAEKVLTWINVLCVNLTYYAFKLSMMFCYNWILA